MNADRDLAIKYTVEKVLRSKGMSCTLRIERTPHEWAKDGYNIFQVGVEGNYNNRLVYCYWPEIMWDSLSDQELIDLFVSSLLMFKDDK